MNMRASVIVSMDTSMRATITVIAIMKSMSMSMNVNMSASASVSTSVIVNVPIGLCWSTFMASFEKE